MLMFIGAELNKKAPKMANKNCVSSKRAKALSIAGIE